jgi:outer membrane protein assembly factor BamA
VELRLVVSGVADADTGTLSVDSLRVRGDGLAVDGRGRVETSMAARLAFDVDVEPALLFPDLTSAGRLSGNGDLKFKRDPDPQLGGKLRIDASEIPGELAQPWVGVEGGGFLDPAGTSLDVSLDLDVNIAVTGNNETRSEDKVLGNAELIWRRDGARLLTASVRSLESGEGVNLSFAGELTPAAPGRRRISGELRARSFVDVLDGTLRSVRVDLVEPDAGEAAVRFGLDPRAIPEWWPRGEVNASLEADGPITTPRLRLDARWDHEDGEPLTVLSARTLDDPSLRLQFEASFLPEVPGQLELSGELAAPGWHKLTDGELRGGRLIVELADFGDVEEELARRLPGLLPEGIVPDEIPNELLRGALAARAGISGAFIAPDVDLEANWRPARGESVHLVVRGRPSAEFPFLAPEGAAALSLENLDLSRFDPTEPPSIGGSIDASVNLTTSDAGFAGSLRLDGRELSYDDVVSVYRLRLEATSDGTAIELREFSGTLAAGTPELPVLGEFTGHGRSDVAWPPPNAEARLLIADPVEGVDRIEMALRLENGILHIEEIEIETPGNVASIRGTMPLDAQAAELATGPMSLSVSNLDLRALTGLFDREQESLPLHGRLNGELTFDPAHPVSAIGSVEVSGIAVGMEGEAPLELEQTLRIEMADGRIVLPPTHLQPTGRLIRGDAPLDISATVILASDWKPGDDFLAAVEDVALDLDGTVDATLLNPFLAGGAASGEVAVKLTARGPPDSLTASLAIRGPQARVLYLRPYPTMLEALEVDLVARQGEVVLERARARLNGGDAEMTGTISAEEGLRAHLRVDGARYRLDFGIATSLRADLQLEWPAEGRRRIGGNVVVERAVLRRPIRLSRDVLGMLFDVRPESGGTLALDTIDLDLIVSTDEGVLIKNNIADVQADWGRVEITGTAASPLFDGRVDVQPGGIITAFGQALRIDEASFEWVGEPIMEPRMVFESTSSSEDPSILKGWRNEFFTPADMGPGRGGTLDFWGQGGGQAGAGTGWEQLAAGAMTQATSATRTQLTFEPLPLFGETDSQARFTLASDLSPQLTFIASTNPRETESQTYILDIHSMPVLQSFRAQVFTNDRKNAGLTLQQTLKLGRRADTEIRDPVLKSTTIDASQGVSKRRIRRAIEFRKSDPFPRGAGLDVEVDVIDLMRRKGFPAATVDVDVDVEPNDNNRVDLVVSVDAGAPVSFVFEGDPLPPKTRKSIAAGYRPNVLGEGAALDEIQQETVKALRGLGYLEPRADVETAPIDPADPDGPSVVRVTADGGRRIDLIEVVVRGLPDEDAERVTDRFKSTMSRMQLAIETPTADALLLRTLSRRGYPEARITDRELSGDGQILVVHVDPGEQQHLVSVEIVGLAEQDRARLAATLDVREGDPAQSDRIGLAGRTIERDLRDRGHSEARVVARVKPAAEDRPFEIELRYEVDPGPTYQIQEVRFEGLKASRLSWVERVAGLETGQVFRRSEVAEARARLFRTGVFQRIVTSSTVENGSEGTQNGHAEATSPEAAGADTVVTFQVEESRRWQLAYGGRWEESAGISAVVDLLNRHSLGIGHVTGIRGILGTEQRNLRLYHIIPRIVGERSSLELFLEGRRERLTDNIDLETAEFWAQLTFPMTARTHSRPYIRLQDPRIIEKAPDPDFMPDERVISPLLGWQVAFDGLSRRIGEQRRRGVFVGIDLLGSHEELGSDVTSLKLVGQLKYFMPVGPETGRFTWAQFWRGGISEAKNQDVPFVDRFRLGGEFSVRGYPTNSLGPTDENGVPLGGEVLFIVNQEVHALLLRTESLGSVSGLAFFDAGNVWQDRDSVSGDLFKSVGLGARYLSPFGPLRLDFAVPLDRRPDDPEYKLYFGFGSVF